MRPKSDDTCKKWLACLGCGRMMWTDRCHRICKKCRRRNEASPVRSPYLVAIPSRLEFQPIESYERDEW
jgi:hypothetical protein